MRTIKFYGALALLALLAMTLHGCLRGSPYRAGEVLGFSIHVQAFYRTRSRIELPRPDGMAGLVGAGFSLSGLLRRFRLRPLAGPSFGHVCVALLRC